MEDWSNNNLEIRRVSFCRIGGSGVWVDGYFLQDSPVVITYECEKNFRDTVFANITGGSNVYALYIQHSWAIITIDKSMFCDIYLAQSHTTVYIREARLAALLRSCFHRLIAGSYTSFVISYYDEDRNRDAAINQTTESKTEGVTKAGQNYRCRDKFVYISNNISHVSVYDHHQGIAIAPVPENNHHVTMNQVVETGTGAIFYLYSIDHLVTISKINFIDNNPTSPYGCFGNERANRGILKDCIFLFNENTVWFGSKYVTKFKYSLIDCYLIGYIPPEHTFISKTD